MEIKNRLEKPYTEQQRIKFIVENNHRLGYEIKETETELQAWGNTDKELLVQAKEQKNNENVVKAKQAIEDGYVIYKEAQFETNAQTVGDLTATMLMMSQSGIEKYSWLSKDDKVVELTLEDFSLLAQEIANYKNSVWNTKYINYKAQIENATTLEEVNAIEIDYTIND